MTRDRYLQLENATFLEMMSPSVSMEEYDFMVENIGKKIEEIQFES